MDRVIRRWLNIILLFITSTFFIYSYTRVDELKYLVKSPNFSLVYPDSKIELPYKLKSLPSLDYNTLIDIKNFKFLINNFPCNKSQPQLLILVSSAPKNYDLRITVRNTWGKSNDQVKLLFLFGETQDDLKTHLKMENEKHKDLIQGNFWDAYRNMTYKQTMGLKWTTYFCQGARFILKTDDDVFVNIKGLQDFLVTELSPWGARNLIMCDIYYKSKVFRSFRSKWRVTVEEYSDDYYPPYCAGYAILYSPDVVFKLYKKAQENKYFWIDDVHVSGILREKINVDLTQSAPLTLSYGQMFIFSSLLKIFINMGKYLYGAPNISHSMINAFWEFTEGFS